MTTHIPVLNRKGLRKFGITTGIIIVILFAVLFPWVFNAEFMPIWPWVVASALWVPALLVPNSLQPVYALWMRLGHAIGWVNTRIILGLVFYIMILPMGLIMRMFGNDPMARKFDKTVSSYRVKTMSEPKERLERPY